MPRPSDQHRHRIVVIGGGAAGLELVTRLGDRLGKRRLADIALIERSRTDLWKPLLHSVAAGNMDPSEHYRLSRSGHRHHFRYHFGEMIGLDRAAKSVSSARPMTTKAARSLPLAVSSMTLSSSRSAA